MAGTEARHAVELRRHLDEGPAADTAEKAREHIEQGELPAVFPPQRGHRPRDHRRIIDPARVSIDPFAGDLAAGVAGRKPDAIGRLKPLHLGRGAVGHRVEFAAVRGNPDGSGHADAVTAKRNQTDIPLSG
jgi:hypothetical protein